MAWVKIDEHFYDHPKWAEAPGDSIALWLAAMAWCNRNDSLDGFIPASKLIGLVNVRNVKRTAADLVHRQAFHPQTRGGASGYLIHDYPEFQQPEKVREIAAKRSANGKKGAAVRWGARQSAAEHAAAPLPPDHQANDMALAIATGVASAIANGVANRCPDTDTDSDVLHLHSTSSSRVPVDGVTKMTEWAEQRRLG